MDSPHYQSTTPAHPIHRVRTVSSLSGHSYVDDRGAIRKSRDHRDRSVSITHAERLQKLAYEQARQEESHALPPSSGFQWITPQHSPQPGTIFAEPSIEPYPIWSAPTPPRSDSGVPSVTTEEPVTTGISASQEFPFDHPTTSSEMSSLGFLLPTQYGSPLYENDLSNYTMDQNYIPPMRMSQPTSTGGSSAYSHTNSTNPALYQSRNVSGTSAPRRYPGMPPAGMDPSQAAAYRPIGAPSYEPSHADYPMATSQSIPPISGLTQSPLPSPHMSTTSSMGGMPAYHTSVSRSPSLYETGMYTPQFSTAPPSAQLYPSAPGLGYGAPPPPPPPFVGSSVNEVLAKPPGSVGVGGDASIRVLNQRPKPQCWEHGCNGRQFSTFSNLLRHQREKSGTAAKSYCPKCGAEFTRTTARNGHLLHDKCTKPGRADEK